MENFFLVALGHFSLFYVFPFMHSRLFYPCLRVITKVQCFGSALILLVWHVYFSLHVLKEHILVGSCYVICCVMLALRYFSLQIVSASVTFVAVFFTIIVVTLLFLFGFTNANTTILQCCLDTIPSCTSFV